MSHIPRKALIFYCPYSKSDHTDISNINQITSKGCSGQIALEIEPSGSDQTVLQLLGLFGTIDIKSDFKQRFDDMSLAIVSNNPHTTQIANQLNCYYENISTQLKIDQLPANVVFVDFTGFDTQDAWPTMDKFASQNSRFDTIQCIISPSSTTEINNNQHWWNSIRPRQSFLMKNGTSLEKVQDKTLMYSYLHIGSSRQDSALTFTESDVKSNGSNGTILAFHLLAEIGHKLGYVPKYGA